ncbi:MAG: hypothetical protein KF729_28565 [Sandaracinaceae bacterium]|nr:hypothetical protein [Sandaracinaceae bacterium]
MRRWLVALNLVLGPLVLASYVVSARAYPEHLEALWGGVPEAARAAYTANMFLAAAGYLVFTWSLVLCTEHARVRFFGGRVSAAILPLAYLAVLAGSIVWMPLTLHAIDARAPALVPWIVVDLAVVAAGSLALLGCVLDATPRPAPRLRVAAIIGALFFCLQTVALDAIVWTLHFEIEPAPAHEEPSRAGERGRA